MVRLLAGCPVVRADIQSFVGLAAFAIGLMSFAIPGLGSIALLMMGATIGMNVTGMLASFATGNVEGGLYYYSLAVLTAFGGFIGMELAQEGGAAIAAGAIHGGFDLGLNSLVCNQGTGCFGYSNP